MLLLLFCSQALAAYALVEAGASQVANFDASMVEWLADNDMPVELKPQHYQFRNNLAE